MAAASTTRALNVANSTLSDNSASSGTSRGGGIFNDGTLTVANSTLSGNSAGGDGGGVENNSGKATVINSTVAGNSAGDTGGGIFIRVGSTMTVINSTIVDNTLDDPNIPGGRGFAGGGTLNLKGTILAANVGSNCAVTIVHDIGYNLYDDNTCPTTSGTSQQVTDAALNLGPLQNNGGPTDTIALLDTPTASVAIDALPTGSCTYINVNPCTNPPTISSGATGSLVCDQRGVPRPQGSACDIGAVEYQALTDFADFDTGLIIFPYQFAAGGSFTLAPDAVFDPPSEAVTVTISSGSPIPTFGPLAVTIPPGSFQLVNGQYKYSGTIGGIKYGVTIGAPVNGVYEFTFAAFGLDVTGITNPVTVIFQIGSNIGANDDVAAAIL